MLLHPSHGGRVAVVDIGSNSIRLVVYDGLKRAAVPLYNEKVLCQLGRGLAATGRLNPEGVQLARLGLARFFALARNMGVSSLEVMATAAVRDASDGREFAREIEEAHGVSVDIISGEREAMLGALGISASIHKPGGIMGDLGGGSLELVRLEGDAQRERITLPVGPLRLIDECGGSRGKMARAIAGRLEQVSWLDGANPPSFYAIGGSFRAIARLHMDACNYPLRVLHEYRVSAPEFAGFAEALARLSPEKLAKMPGLPAKRAPAIPPAAMILSEVIARARPESIVFSASGIREGYLFEKLPAHIRLEDGLLSTCTEIATKSGRSTAYAEELLRWMSPLFGHERAEEERLRVAFCLISDLAHHLHPEYRADWAMQRVLQSSFTSLSHAERAALSLAMYHRYQYKLPKYEADVLALIGARARAWARLSGTCANLAYHLSGSIPGTLRDTALRREKGGVALDLRESAAALVGEAVRKRVGGVKEAFEEWVKYA